MSSFLRTIQKRALKRAGLHRKIIDGVPVIANADGEKIGLQYPVPVGVKKG